jgi:hypothetical protein
MRKLALRRKVSCLAHAVTQTGSYSPITLNRCVVQQKAGVMQQVAHGRYNGGCRFLWVPQKNIPTPGARPYRALNAGSLRESSR